MAERRTTRRRQKRGRTRRQELPELRTLSVGKRRQRSVAAPALGAGDMRKLALNFLGKHLKADELTGDAEPERIGDCELVRALGEERFLGNDPRPDGGEVLILRFPACASEAGEAFLQRTLELPLPEHPSVGLILEAGLEGSRPFLVLETLDQGLSTPEFPFDTRLDALERVARGLSAAHRRGLVHGWIGPEQVQLGVPAFLVGVGVRELCEQGALPPPAAAEWAAPELAQAPGPACDVYSLGAVLRELLPPDAAPELTSLVAASLDPDPAARPSAGVFADRLAARARLAEERALRKRAQAVGLGLALLILAVASALAS